MEIKVTVELGPKTFALLDGFKAVKTVATTSVEEAVEKPKRTRTTPKVIPVQQEAQKVLPPVKEEPKKSEAFEDLDDDAKLEAIKAEVTKHTKKGKSVDIKALLGGFDANRASELAPEDYNAFYNAVKRYGAGESVNDIIGLD